MSGIQLGLAGNVSLCCDMGLVGKYPKYVPKYSKYVTGRSASRVELFQQRKPSPQFFSEKEGGAGDNYTRCAWAGGTFFSSCAVASVFGSGGK
jgi:hypothetical protein